jgi:hypothetical protein
MGAATTEETTMKTVLALLFGFAIAGQAQAQTAPSAQHMPRGAAVDITNAEILSTVLYRSFQGETAAEGRGSRTRNPVDSAR